MTVKPSDDAEELITAADYDKVMEYLQETPRTNKLKILQRVTLYSLEIIELHSKEQDKHLEKEKKPVVVPTKKRSQRPCKVNEKSSLKKLKFKEYHHLESSNWKTVNRQTAAINSHKTDLSHVIVEEEEIEDGEWHPKSISNSEKREKKKKKVVSRVKNPNPDEDPHDQYYEEPSLKKLKSKEYHHPESSNEKKVTSDLHKNTRKPKPTNPNPRNPNPTNGPPQSREIPSFLSEMMERMNGSEIVLIIEKALTNSDVNRYLSRLQMPESQMNEFLREEEKEHLKIKEGNNMNGIEALLHQRGGELRSKVKLKRWKMPKENNKGSIVYVLGSGWNDVVARNKLRSGDVVQVWSFRVDKELHFALVLL